MITEREINLLTAAGLFKVGNMSPSELEKGPKTENPSPEEATIERILGTEGYTIIHKQINTIAEKARKGQINTSDLNDKRLEIAGIFTLQDILDIKSWFDENQDK